MMVSKNLPLLLSSLPLCLAMTHAFSAERSHSHTYFLQSNPPEKQGGIEFDVAGLYWKSYVPNLWYVIHQPPENRSVSQTVTLLGDLKEPTYDAHMGYRAGVAYNFKKQPFGVHATYTRFHDRGSSSVQNQNDGTTYASIDEQIFVTEGTSKLNLHYYAWDLYALYSILRTSHFGVNLQFGAIESRVAQSFVTNLVIPTQGGFSYPTLKIKNDWRFVGAGPKVGLSGEYRLVSNFHIHAGATFAPEIGYYKFRYFEGSPPNSPTDTQNILGDVHFSERKWIFTFQTFAGLDYKVNTSHFSFSFFADYEANIWLDIHQRMLGRPQVVYLSRIVTLMNENLGMQGITFGAKVEF